MALSGAEYAEAMDIATTGKTFLAAGTRGPSDKRSGGALWRIRSGGRPDAGFDIGEGAT